MFALFYAHSSLFLLSFITSYSSFLFWPLSFSSLYYCSPSVYSSFLLSPSLSLLTREWNHKERRIYAVLKEAIQKVTPLIVLSLWKWRKGTEKETTTKGITVSLSFSKTAKDEWEWNNTETSSLFLSHLQQSLCQSIHFFRQLWSDSFHYHFRYHFIFSLCLLLLLWLWMQIDKESSSLRKEKKETFIKVFVFVHMLEKRER